MTATDDSVLVCRDAGLAVVTLNRPDKLNPLDWPTVRRLKADVAELEAAAEIRVVIVTGAGKAFSAGGDLTGYLELYRRPDDFRAFLGDFHDLCIGIERSTRIYIAAVNGVTVAGGLELMLCCDLVLAAADAKIGDGHINFAQMPGAGGSQRLPRAVGALRAKQLMLTGALLHADAAADIGLVNGVVPGDDLMDAARALGADLLTKSPTALKGMKYLVNRGLQTDLDAGLQLEIAYTHNHATAEPDAMEGLRAFAEKRKPVFKDNG